jgi:uncharacterized membrane protein
MLNPFTLIGRLWRFSMGQVPTRPGHGKAGLKVFLILLFLLVAIVVQVFGISPERVDLWLAANGGWLEAIGNLLFRAFCAAILLLCAIICLTMVYSVLNALRGSAPDDRKLIAVSAEELAEEPTKPPGAFSLGCGFLAAVIVGYFAWFGMVG